MPTIIRQGGFELMIFTNDHAPAHVHVFKAGAEAVVDLDPIAIRESYRMTRRDLRRALDIVIEHRPRLLEAWRDIHGD